MAITSFTPDAKGSGATPVALAGGYWLLAGRIVFTGSYAAGGDSLDLSRFVPAMGTVREVICLSTVRGLTPEYDVVNKKLKLFGTNPAAATLDLGPMEHPAAAYDADITGSSVPIAFLVK